MSFTNQNIPYRRLLGRYRPAPAGDTYTAADLHGRLDDMGVPNDPAPEQTQRTGHRLTGRLDWVAERIVRADNERLKCLTLELILDQKMEAPRPTRPPLPANLQRLRANWEIRQTASPAHKSILETAKQVRRLLYGTFEDIVSPQGHYISVRVFRGHQGHWELAAALGRHDKAECSFDLQGDRVVTQIILGQDATPWQPLGVDQIAERLADYLFRDPTISPTYNG